MRLRTFLLGVAAAVAVTIFYQQTAARPLQVTVDLTVSRSTRVRLLVVPKTGLPIILHRDVGAAGRHVLIFAVNDAGLRIYRLGVAPLSHKGTFTLHRLSFTSADGRQNQTWDRLTLARNWIKLDGQAMVVFIPKSISGIVFGYPSFIAFSGVPSWGRTGPPPGQSVFLGILAMLAVFSLPWILAPRNQKGQGVTLQPLRRESRITETVIPSVFIVWFLFQALYYALMLPLQVSYDENYHLELAQRYASLDREFIEKKDILFSPYGMMVSREPYAYHCLMGFLLRLNIFGIPALLFLRALNILIGLGSVWVFYRTLRLLTQDGWVRCGAIALLTNLSCFVILSGAVHYDNYCNFFSFLTLYLFVRYLGSFKRRTLLYWVLAAAAGALGKFTILPLIGLQSAVLAWYLWRRRSRMTGALFKRPLSAFETVLLAAIAVLAALNLGVYLVNLLRYHSLTWVSAGYVLKEHGLRGVSVADQWFDSFVGTASQRQPLPAIAFVWQALVRMESAVLYPSLYSNLSVKHLLIWPHLLWLAALALFLRNARSLLNRQTAALFAVGSGYVIFLLVYLHGVYLQTHDLKISILGRYLLPALSPAILFFAAGFFGGIRPALRAIAFVLVAILFVRQGLPCFVEYGFIFGL